MSEPNESFEESLFQAALEKSSAEERAAFLDGACRDDPALRARLDVLLEGCLGAEGFMPDPPASQPAAVPVIEKPGDRIGRYKLREKLGEGGCGVVYVAEQEEPVRRKVALKVIKLGMDTRNVVARFEAERQALAMMDHPNIAKVLEAGATETGRPYFVMELVRGVKITEHCDQHQLSTRERLELFIKVCQAVQHAHQKGIIHRDLKPSNILVTVNDGAPVPKVIDFGIAKATEGRLTALTVYTDLHQFIGTPAYMSPEQATMTSLDIDTRSDIYTLGVLLYELLTGRTPFDSKELMAQGLDALRRTIREKEPARPSTRLSTMLAGDLTTTAKKRASEPPTLIRQVRGDLDWIVMKCLEKDRARRYETANGLAMDLQRHLGNEPVAARPPSRLYELQKTVRRHRLGFAAVAAVISVLAAGVVVSTRQAARAQNANRVARRNLYAGNMRLAQAAWEQNRVAQVRQILEETADDPERGFEWYYWQRQTHLELKTLRGHLDQIYGVAFSPDGRRIATASYDRTAKVWDPATGEELLTLTGHLAAVTSVAFSPDGRRLLTGSTDATARLWDALSGKEIMPPLKAHRSDIWSAAFSPDGRQIITGGCDRTAKVCDAANGNLLLTLKGHEADVNVVAFSPDGRRILTASDDHTAKVWDALSGTNLLTLKGVTPCPHIAAFSPDSQRIVTGGEDHLVRVWDAASGRQLLTLHGHRASIYCVAFSPDGQWIISGSLDQTAKVWDAASGNEFVTLKGHTSWLTAVAFSPDGKRIVTAGGDHTAKVWEAPPNDGSLTLRGHTDILLALAFSPNGERLVTGGVDGTARVWETASGKLLLNLPAGGSIRGAAFSPEGRRIATASEDQTATLWDAASGARLFTLTGHSGPVTSVGFSPDGRRLATASADQTTKVWETATGKYLFTLRGHNAGILAVAFSPDGRRIVTGGDDRTARVWDAGSGRQLLVLTGHDGYLTSVAYSPNGRQIVTASSDTTATVWDAIRGVKSLTLKGHSGQVWGAAFSPDGRRIVTGSYDFTAKVWDASSGQDLLTLNGHTDRLYAAAFSPDGQRIATCSVDLTAKVWQAATVDQVSLWQNQEKDASQRLIALGRERDAAAQRERAVRDQDRGVVKQWLVLAPLRFTNQSAAAALASEQLPDEAHLRPRIGEPVHAVQGAQVWRAIELEDYMIDFGVLSLSRMNRSLAYAACYILSETNRHGLCLKVGSCNQSKVYLNEKEIYRWEGARSYVSDQDVVTGVELKAGVNVLVFKLAIEQFSDFNWQGSIRFTDADGQPVKGIRATIAPASAQDPGAIREWLLLAPIHFSGTNGAKALAQQQIPDEAHLRPRAGDRSRIGGSDLVWQEFHLDDYGLDFRELTRKTHANWRLAYAVCYIESEASQPDLIMKVGSDDQSKVYLNGKEIYRYEEPRPFVPDEDEVRGVALQAGLNVLVFKVVNEQQDWRGSIRFTDAAGQPVKGIRVSLAPPPLR